MKKQILASAIALGLGVVATNATAVSVDVTNMVFGGTYAVTGTLSDNGTGHIDGAPFYGQPFSADAVAYFGTSGTWAGTAPAGAFSYQFTLSPTQVAFGTMFNWNGNNGIPVLAIFDCGAGNAGDACVGTGTPMQTPPFKGAAPVFNGTVSAVPVPAAAWLMGSGLLGLVGVARRRKQA